MKRFEDMKVAELKQECRDRGLKLEHKGHKFNKAELIEQLNNYEDAKRAEEVVAEKENKTEEQETKEVKQETKVEEQEEDKSKIVYFATTLDEIVTKYGHRKKQNVYDNELQVGSFVIFIHYVEAKDGEIYKKLRTAKVVGVNRKQELVRIKTLLGTEMVLGFEDLLYIRKNQRGCDYPMDLNTYLKQQRTEKGRKLINERFAENVASN